MKKIIAALFSNRFGIVLAALNAAYFAGHGIGPMGRLPGMFFACANLPAGLATALTLESVRLFLAPPSASSLAPIFAGAVFGGFVVLQWLSIAWFAKKMAAGFKPADLT
jgi:hypothetical protein